VATCTTIGAYSPFQSHIALRRASIGGMVSESFSV